MKVTSVKFVTSAAERSQYVKDGRPEFAFVGRSNVGKSTMLNVLLNKKGLAKTSKTPGKTRLVNFFDVNDHFYFVDLPGYGFAKVSKGMKRAWQKVITGYLADREPLRLVFHLIDSRHNPTADDHDVLDILDEAQVPTLIVATKVDKLRPSQRQAAVAKLRRSLDLDSDALIIPFSSITKHGIRDLWHVVDDCLQA